MNKLFVAAVALSSLVATGASAITITDIGADPDVDVTGGTVIVDELFSSEYVFEFDAGDLSIGSNNFFGSASLKFDASGAGASLPLPGFASAFTFNSGDFGPGGKAFIAWSDAALSFDGTSFSGGVIYDMDEFDPTQQGIEGRVTTAFAAPDDTMQFLNIAFTGLVKFNGTSVFAEVSAVPLPASVLLFMSALAGLGFVSRARKSA